MSTYELKEIYMAISLPKAIISQSLVTYICQLYFTNSNRYNRIATMSANLSDQINQFATLLQTFSADATQAVHLRELKKNIHAEFKEINAKLPEEKLTQWNEFQELITQFNTINQQWQLESESFAVEANHRIDAFEQSIIQRITPKATKDDYTALRAEADVVYEFIKQPQWPSKEIRTAAWDKFKRIKDQFRDLENNFYAQLKEERQQKADKSAALTPLFCTVLQTCLPELPVQNTMQSFTQFQESLAQLGIILNDEQVLPSEQEAQSTSLKTQSDILQRIRQVAFVQRDSFVWEHRQQVFNLIDSVKEALDKAWEIHKVALQQKKEERIQKKKEWETKQQSFLQMLEQRLEKQWEYKQKLESFGISQNDFLARIDTRQSSQKAYLEKLYADLEELQEQYNTAWSDNFKQRTELRIVSKKSKITEVENDIAAGEQKREDANNQLLVLPNRVEEVVKTITEIQSKIIEVKEKLNLPA